MFINKLKKNERQEVINFINYLLWRQQKIEAHEAKGYDFSDIAGKLAWQGNAVAAQREIRDEW
jgi:hypothetical protein